MSTIKDLIFILVVALLTLIPQLVSGQFLSHLDATKDDALFTTYAAPISRSSYKIDQGYQFLWNDENNGAEFISKDGLNFGLAVIQENKLRFRLNEMYREPVVTVSYNDLVSYYYYPSKDIRIEVVFDVYSSSEAIADITVRNEGGFPLEINVAPYLYFPATDTVNDIIHQSPFDLYSFHLKKERDSWMKEHSIPVEEELKGFLAGNIVFDSTLSFVCRKSDQGQLNTNDPFRSLKKQLCTNKKDNKGIKGLICLRELRIYPGEQTNFRMVFGLTETKMRIPDLGRKIHPLFSLDLKKLVSDDEKDYGKIPQLLMLNQTGINKKSPNLSKSSLLYDSLDQRDLNYFYWSCFSLLRQCMMPAEGECKDNYYIFSREPKWGWGYGGQVFHESLSMLAYAYMDPIGAMNSQRVYFERQHPDGYINYRTGPYLDETIEFKGKLTTSAPFLNFEDLEIFKITHDKHFLEEAYKSGAKFYNYFISNRDSNSNGLCEWGGEASLESVRDARVAVWDNVGWPSNFEGPDLNSMLVKEANSLSEMAMILGFHDEARKWSIDAANRSKLINKYLWDDKTGFYYNVNKNDQSFSFKDRDDLKIKEIIGFLPLWAGISDSVKTRRLISSLLDTGEFWRPFGVPTLSARDKYYNPMGYWNGPVWVQWDYLIFRGLLDHGYKAEAESLAAKVLDNMIWHLKQDHVFWEFYSPDDHEAGWNKTYIWAGLAARFLIDLEK